MATTSKILTLDSERLANGALDIDWVEVIEKMNSTPGTPRQEANDSHIPAEKTTAPASPTMTSEREEDSQIPPKSTMRIVPHSSVENKQIIAELTPPQSPLDLSIAEKPDTLETALIQSRNNLSSNSKDENGILGVQVADVLEAKDNIPVDLNRTEARSTQSPTLEVTKEGNQALNSLPLSIPDFPAVPPSKITEEVESMRPTAVEAKETRASVSEEERKIMDVIEKTNSNSEGPNLEVDKKEEVDLKGPVVLPSSTVSGKEERVAEDTKSNFPPTILKADNMEKTVLEEPTVSSQLTSSKDDKKEETAVEEPTTISQLPALEEKKNPVDLEDKADLSNSREGREVEATKEIEKLEHSAAEEIPLSSSLPKEEQVSHDQKDTEQKPVMDEAAQPDRSLSVSIPKPEKSTEDKKSLQLLTKLKRKLSTKNMKDYKHEPAPPTPTTALNSPPTPTTAVSSPSTSIDGPKHIELVRTKTKTSTGSPKEGKKIDTLFKSLRAVMSFSGRHSPKSPKTDTTPAPSPIATRSRTWDRKSSKPSSPTMVKSPIRRPSTAVAISRSSEKSPLSPQQQFPLEKKPTIKQTKPTHVSLPKPQPSVRRPGHNSPHVKANLKTAQTWSPPSSTPVLASNPDAKLYTIWPRYPVVQVQTDEIQAVLDGFLPNDQSAIEKSFAPGSNDGMVNFWKAPLTTEQAEVVKAINCVSSIQLSKLDYDPSDYFC